MDLKKVPSKKVILAVCAVAAVVWMLVWLLGPKPERVEPVQQPTISLASLGSQEVQENRERPTDSVPDTWGNDPFAMPEVIAKVDESQEGKAEAAAQGQQLVQPGSHKVTAIVFSDSNKLAVINDRVLAEGDLIDGQTVSQITMHHVILTGSAGHQVLKVPGPQTEIEVQSPEAM